MAQRTYRVTVRGRFDGLDDATRARLQSEAAEHDVLVARFTDEGTLTYDQRLDAFQHRVVVRVDEGRGRRTSHGRRRSWRPWSTSRPPVSGSASCGPAPRASTT